jgi:adenylate kinase family enzyme
MVNLNISILIIGKICSGKSTLAKDFSKWLKFPIASFGGYLVNYSLQNDLPTDRESLQDLGTQMINNQHTQFLESVIKYSAPSPSSLIFEGVRHKVILDEIKKNSSKTFSIYLDVKEDVRIERFVKREKAIDANNKALEDFYKRSQHPVEQEVENLRNECNYIIVSNDSYRDFLRALGMDI